jgi:hypothetical protein
MFNTMTIKSVAKSTDSEVRLRAGQVAILITDANTSVMGQATRFTAKDETLEEAIARLKPKIEEEFMECVPIALILDGELVWMASKPGGSFTPPIETDDDGDTRYWGCI